MLTAECYKQRMERGLSFLEFNYMIMQSYDFYMLFQKYGCNMQFGGDDQWSNMLGGTELIRRKLGKDAYAMTITLLLNSEGKKMGKTQSGAVWLDPDKTSPFDFYQYWRNVADADVLKCLRMLTFLPLEQIDEMDHWEGSPGYSGGKGQSRTGCAADLRRRGCVNTLPSKFYKEIRPGASSARCSIPSARWFPWCSITGTTERSW